ETVSVQTIASGLKTPLDVVFPSDTDLRYIATKPGLIHVHGPDGLHDQPLLDLRKQVINANERGLLGIALHPDFKRNRRLFVRYSAPSRAETPDDYNHTFVLAEFDVTADGMRALPDTEQPIMEIPQPHGVHNSGDITFGPEGYLYVPTGDGGNRADFGKGHVKDWYTKNLGGNGQDVTENLLGSILRIDIDADGEGDRSYGIPDDNPLIGRKGLDEHYAWGFRNPWRSSFDGDQYFVGDVGQNLAEEINLVEKGGNYGWNVKEGYYCFDSVNNSQPREDCPDATPENVRGGEPLLDPIVAYPNESPTAGTINGLAVVGGYVYRGRALPGLFGRYVFGDFQPNGRLFVATPPEIGDGEAWRIDILPLARDATDKLGTLFSFGQGPDNELYVLGGEGLHHIIPA
ncbi:MAG: sorbosone dehydrogenase family protein, partial [Halobacteriales archaeon]